MGVILCSKQFSFEIETEFFFHESHFLSTILNVHASLSLIALGHFPPQGDGDHYDFLGHPPNAVHFMMMAILMIPGMEHGIHYTPESENKRMNDSDAALVKCVKGGECGCGSWE